MKTRRALAGCLGIGLMVCAGMAKPSYAQTGSVRVIFSKASFVAGIAGGSGVLTFHGKRYPFKISGAGLGAIIGVSTNVLKGAALNLHRPQDLAGAYTAFGAGGAVAAGVSAVRLTNANGVMLVLGGAKLGVELSANLAYVTITM
jgi:hypothetical protein